MKHPVVATNDGAREDNDMTTVSWTRKSWARIPASAYRLDEGRVHLAHERTAERAALNTNSKGKANITKMRPWSALSKDSSACSHQPHTPTTSQQPRPKTASGDQSKPTEPSPNNHQCVTKPRLKVQSRLRNGNPVTPGGGRRSARRNGTPHIEITKPGKGKGGRSGGGDRKRSTSRDKKNNSDKVKKKPWTTTEIPESAYNSTGIESSGERDGSVSPARSGATTPGGDDDASSLASRPETRTAVEDETADDEDRVKRRSAEKKAVAELRLFANDVEPGSDEYDTDLEDDFPPEDDIPYDSTGKYVYQSKCKNSGIVPVSFLIRNLGEGNLKMRHHYLGGEGTKPLAEALKVNTVCEEIDLSDNYIEGSGAAAIAGVLKDNMFIVNLNISNNFIRAQGADAFCEALEANTTLKTLSLKGNQMSDSDGEKIGKALESNMSLNCLDLSYNCFGEIGGIHLGAGLAANVGLADLDLSWNCLNGKGGVAIMKALSKNNILEILDMSWNGIANIGAAALGNTLKENHHLKVLDISNNRIGREGAVKLAQGIAKNAGLETLLMGMNPIGEEGTEAILKGIMKNTALKLVGLEDIAISKALQEKIKELTDNRDILIMYSSGSPQQSRINQTILAVFDRFISENADRMEDLFNQMDKDKSGDITLEEFKYGLKDFGLRLTSKQLDSLLEELDADKSGTIELETLYQMFPQFKRASGRV